MESQPQNPVLNPDFRINPENFHPCVHNSFLNRADLCCLDKMH